MVRRWFFVTLVLTMVLGSMGGSLRARAQGSNDGSEQAGPVFVNGDWRVSLVAATSGESIQAAGLKSVSGKQWVVVIADVTNLSDHSQAFPISDATLATHAGGSSSTTATVLSGLNLRAGPSTDTDILAAMPAGATVDVTGDAKDGFLPVTYQGTDGWASAEGLSLGDETTPEVNADSAANKTAAGKLHTTTLDGGSTDQIDANGTVRVAIAYSAPKDVQRLVFRFGAGIDLGDLISEKADLANLGDAVAPELHKVTVSDVVNGKTVRLGNNERVELIGVDAPTGSECFAKDATNSLKDLTDGTVYIERGPSSGDDDAFAYLWLERDGARALINHELIANGDAGVSFDGQDGEARFNQWFEQDGDTAKDKEQGLWAKCTGVHGKTKPKPTTPPTPTPDAAQARAEYSTVTDIRDLAIRYGDFDGEKLSFSGTVLTIHVAGRGKIYPVGDDEVHEVKAVLQVDVLAPDGTTETVFIGYDGESDGIYEGSYVTIYGTGAGTFTFENAYGGGITQPLVIADIIDVS